MLRNGLKIAAAGLMMAAGPAAVLAQGNVGGGSFEAIHTAGDPVGDYQKAMTEQRFGDALAALARLPVDPDNSDGRAVVAAMRASALLGLNRDEEARKQIAEAERLAPALPEPTSLVLFGALLSKHYDLAAEMLDRMLARYPDAVRDFDESLIRFFLMNEPKGQVERNAQRRIELARIGYGGDTESGHYMASTAVDLLVDQGKFDEAAELLPYVKEPVAFENMLIQKRYAPLWPRIEQIAGNHLESARDQTVAAAKRGYEKDPSDFDALANYANALRHSGRLSEAIALRSKLPATSAAMSSADEEVGWAVNNVALALHDSGRKDDADKLFALLNEAPMPEELWRVSMKINRLELLVQDGEFVRALPLIEPTAKAEGSPYAEQLVRRLRFCTMAGLGKAAEAETRKPELLAHASDAPEPTMDALLCAHDLGGAEKVAMTALANPDAEKRHAFEEDFVRHLQAHRLTGDDPSQWQSGWTELRRRPAIAAAFERLGREMPQHLLPEPPR